MWFGFRVEELSAEQSRDKKNWRSVGMKVGHSKDSHDA